MLSRTISLALLFVCFLASAAILSADIAHQKNKNPAAEPSGKAVNPEKRKAPKRQKWTGILIDNHSVELYRDSLAVYIKRHTRECMIKNGKGKYSLYLPEQKKVIPIVMEAGGCFQGYVEHFQDSLKIEISGFWKGDSIYSESFHSVQ